MPTVTALQLEAALALRDLTDPTQGSHAMQHIVSKAEAALVHAWAIPVLRSPGNRVVSVSDNYDRLGYDPAAVTRESRYTRYISGTHLLRSHTTAAIPKLLAQSNADVVYSVPGICYRRDSIDSQHTGEPHQLDLWRVSHTAPLTEDDLEEMVAAVVQATLPGRNWWTVPSTHPYTVAGREIYVSDGDQAVEIGECGLAHPQLLAAAGLPPTVSGLAMGLGADRLLMLAKQIPDIRLLRSTDPRVAAQMNDLDLYRPISPMPATLRDISIAVHEHLDVELAGDHVRLLLADDADSIEDLTVLSQTPYEQLPPAAIARMGISPG
jgi:phenylalanyl-tRNA synthetase alpha chain